MTKVVTSKERDKVSQNFKHAFLLKDINQYASFPLYKVAQFQGQLNLYIMQLVLISIQ